MEMTVSAKTVTSVSESRWDASSLVLNCYRFILANSDYKEKILISERRIKP